MKRNAAVLVAGAAMIGAGLTAAPLSTPVADAAPASSVAHDSEAAQKAVAFARDAVGTPYSYGGSSSSGYDCSGLTSAAWKSAGKDVPRTSKAQDSAGTGVSRSEIKIGDLVTYYSPVHHVGIYVGHGKIVHAPSTGTTVTEADIDSMPITSIRHIG